MLVVEDGTGLPNADSYQSLVDARALASDYGVVLPVDDTEAEISLRNGTRYVDGYEARFSGTRLLSTQALSYPRSGGYRCFGNNYIDVIDGVIPSELIIAQLFAAVEYGKGTDVMPADNGLSVKLNEVVGAVKQEYFDNGKTGAEIFITRANDALRPILCISSGLSARTVRV